MVDCGQQGVSVQDAMGSVHEMQGFGSIIEPGGITEVAMLGFALAWV